MSPWPKEKSSVLAIRQLSLLTEGQRDTLIDADDRIEPDTQYDRTYHVYLPLRWWHRHLERRLGDEGKDDVLIDRLGDRVAAILQKHCLTVMSVALNDVLGTVSFDFKADNDQDTTRYYLRCSFYGSQRRLVSQLTALYLTSHSAEWVWSRRKDFRKSVKNYALLPRACKQIAC